MNNERLNGLELGENIESMFKVEPPLTPSPSEYGYIGVLLRNKLEDKIQCHICGGWFKAVGQHANQAHNMTSDEYRKKFSLPLNFPLCARSVSKHNSDRQLKPENFAKFMKVRKTGKCYNNKKRIQSMKYYFNSEAHKNKVGLCSAQIVSRYQVLCEMLGRQASQRDLQTHEPALWGGIRRRFKNFNNFKKENNYEFTDKYSQKFTDEKLIGILRAFYRKNKRNPTTNDFISGQPTTTTFRNHFGSWSKALQSAGFIRQ